MNGIDKLYRQWRSYWDERQSIDPAVDKIFGLLVAAYTHPDRHYHNLVHIQSVLAILERFAIDDPIAVSLAAWFHDFIYDPQASDNEIQSAKAAKKLLTNLGIAIDRIDRIERLILATAGHRIDPDDADLCLFLDADLAILGTNPVTYQAYATAIRREYEWVPDVEYRAGRIRILESFLQRDRLYYTPQLFAELESIARLNIRQEIDLLVKYKTD
jgi:predicted metal-dependent HD superfamily phosphohydrolase